MNSMDTARSATPPVPAAGKDADRQHGKLAEKVMVKNLNFYTTAIIGCSKQSMCRGRGCMSGP